MDSAPSVEFRSVRDNPWWIPPFLGGVPVGVSPAQLRLLGVLTFALFFENYDLSVLGNALPQIAASFGLSKGELGDFTSITRLGSLPAFLLIPLADRIGRRRLLLFSVACMSVGSALTATSQTATQFVLFQFMTRAFLVASAIVAVVIITEEFPAEYRGWGIGMLAGVSSIGFGLGAALYGAVKVLPFGWRALYLVGLAPVALFFWLRSGVVETRRFERARGQSLAREGVRAAVAGAFAPLAALAREYPLRALTLGAVGIFSSAGIGVSFQFVSQFLQTERGWSPAEFGVMSIFFGAFGIIGNLVAGRLADRFGRRAIAAAGLAGFPLVALAFYAGPAWAVALPWTAMVFLNMAAGVMLRALTTELFPTAFRSAAGGTQAMLETLGVVSGLWLYSRVMDRLDDQQVVIPLLSLATLVAAAAIWLLPETARRELEQISQEEPAQ